jgi:hypothetical protein
LAHLIGHKVILILAAKAKGDLELNGHPSTSLSPI